MTQKHTPEPWVRSSEDFIAAESDQLNNGEYILSCFGPDQAANARRIVACVNACINIPTDWLEASVAFMAQSGEMMTLEAARSNARAWQSDLIKAKKQRDELLVALEIAEECLSGIEYTDYPVSDELTKIRAAITKAKGAAAITKTTGETK